MTPVNTSVKNQETEPTPRHVCPVCQKTFSAGANLLRHQKLHDPDLETFKCTLCDFSTKHETSLIGHNRVHTGEKPFKCPFPDCTYTAAYETSIKKHQAVHTQQKHIRCPKSDCTFSTAYKDHLNRHLKVAHELQGERPFPCPLCPYRASTHCNLQKHNTVVHVSGRSYVCPQSGCDYAGKTVFALRQHEVVHVVDKAFPCLHQGCEYRAKSQYHLNGHIKMRHSTTLTNLQCALCPYSTPFGGNLNRHMRRHTGELPWACPVCPKKFKSSYELKTHMAMHGEERPFLCAHPGCNYAAKLESYLREHRKTHTDEKPYACPHPSCTYRGKTKGNLRDHARVHVQGSDGHRFKCSFCQYSTEYSGALEGHMRTHTKETPYACKICGFRTTTASHLIRHVRLHGVDGQKVIKVQGRPKAKKVQERNGSGRSRSVWRCPVSRCNFSVSMDDQTGKKAGEAVIAGHLMEQHDLPRVLVKRM